jgi:hypothetical protein
MDLIELRGRLVEEYVRYTRRCIKIADLRIDGKVQNALTTGALWPGECEEFSESRGGSSDRVVRTHAC